MRLINLDTIKPIDFPSCEMDGLDVVRYLDALPTVDAVEVVHGRWEDMFGSKYANPRYRCSACKEKALYRLKKNGLDQWEEVQALTDYCPNCGAKMDLEG